MQMTSHIIAVLEEKINMEEKGVEEEKQNRERTFILCVAQRSSVQVQICGDSTFVRDEISRRPKLFLIFCTMHSNYLWMNADSGSGRNLISLEAFNILSFKNF